MDQIGTVTPQMLERAANNAWKKYEAKYSEPRRQAFQKTFESALEKFDAERIAPLADAHAAWMKSGRMAAYFACNFDTANPHSGIVYVETLSLCIGATQDKKACFDVYAEWYLGDIADRGNLLLRAFALNQDSIAAVIAKGAGNVTDLRTLPWDGMIGHVGTMLDNVLLHKPDTLGKLVMQTVGPLAQTAKKFAQSGPLPHALIAAGVLNKTPILRITFTGTLAEFQEHVVKELIKARGADGNVHGLKAAVRRELKLLEIKGGKLTGTRSKSFLVVVDQDALHATPAAGKQRVIAHALSKAMANVNDLETLELGRWRSALSRGATVTKAGMPFLFGALGGALQLVALNSLAEELDKAAAAGKGIGTTFAKYVAGTAAFAGTIADMAHKALEKFSNISLKMGRGLAGHFNTLLKVSGKTLGVAGALIVAICDWQNSNEAKQKGQIGLSYAYRASAIFGLSGALLLLSGAAFATGIGIFLILLAIAITFLIDHIKDNPLQEWLEEGYFNKKLFPTMEVEMEKFKAIAN